MVFVILSFSNLLLKKKKIKCKSFRLKCCKTGFDCTLCTNIFILFLELRWPFSSRGVGGGGISGQTTKKRKKCWLPLPFSHLNFQLLWIRKRRLIFNTWITWIKVNKFSLNLVLMGGWNCAFLTGGGVDSIHTNFIRDNNRKSNMITHYV